MQRTDSEILRWVAKLFEPGDELFKEDALLRIEGAFSCGLTGRAALEAAMGAVLLEPGEPMPPLTGIQRIAIERERQIAADDRTLEWDRTVNAHGELVDAAVCYCDGDVQGMSQRMGAEGYDNCPQRWPWDETWWKPSTDSNIRNLEKAGALLAAEIDRLLDQRISGTVTITAEPRIDIELTPGGTVADPYETGL